MTNYQVLSGQEKWRREEEQIWGILFAGIGTEWQILTIFHRNSIPFSGCLEAQCQTRLSVGVWYDICCCAKLISQLPTAMSVTICTLCPFSCPSQPCNTQKSKKHGSFINACPHKLGRVSKIWCGYRVTYHFFSSYSIKHPLTAWACVCDFESRSWQAGTQLYQTQSQVFSTITILAF